MVLRTAIRSCDNHDFSWIITESIHPQRLIYYHRTTHHPQGNLEPSSSLLLSPPRSWDQLCQHFLNISKEKFFLTSVVIFAPREDGKKTAEADFFFLRSVCLCLWDTFCSSRATRLCLSQTLMLHTCNYVHEKKLFTV